VARPRLGPAGEGPVGPPFSGTSGWLTPRRPRSSWSKDRHLPNCTGSRFLLSRSIVQIVVHSRTASRPVHAALAEVVARRRRAVLARLDFPEPTLDALASMRAPRLFDVPAEKPGPTEEPRAPEESAARPGGAG
jgi:hypothetical protein